MTSLRKYLQPIMPIYGYCEGLIRDDEVCLRNGIKAFTCGRPLYAPYFITYQDRQDFLVSDPCMNPDDEAIQTIKLAEFIKCRYENFVPDSIGHKYDALGYYFIPGYRAEQGPKMFRDFFVNSTLRGKKILCQRCCNYQRKCAETKLAKKMFL